jgi:hypothetical protein
LLANAVHAPHQATRVQRSALPVTLGASMDETSISFYGNPNETALAWCLDRALRDALGLKSKLPDWIMTMPGMSGRKYRRMINQLVGLAPQPRYLEVGSWAGSTACSAMYGNALPVTCIDNWSEFGGPRAAFDQATDAARSDQIAFRVIEEDFRKVDYSAIGTYNIYLFDGPHEYQDQFDGVTMAQPALADEHILIVDDWNWPQVRQGTIDAITKLGMRIISGVEIKTNQVDAHPATSFEASEWHNGYLLAVLART